MRVHPIIWLTAISWAFVFFLVWAVWNLLPNNSVDLGGDGAQTRFYPSPPVPEYRPRGSFTGTTSWTSTSGTTSTVMFTGTSSTTRAVNQALATAEVICSTLPSVATLTRAVAR